MVVSVSKMVKMLSNLEKKYFKTLFKILKAAICHSLQLKLQSKSTTKTRTTLNELILMSDTSLASSTFNMFLSHTQRDGWLIDS